MPKFQWKTGVYCWLNLVNNKVYVGSSAVSLIGRRKVHESKLIGGYSHNKHLQSAWNKYGQNNFEFVVLELCGPKLCIEKEQYWIDELKACNPEFGYNTNPTAGNSLGAKRSEAAKAHLSMIVTEYMNRPEVRKANSERTKIAMNRPDVKAKMARARNNPSTIEKMAKSHSCPIYRANQSKLMKEIANRPEVKLHRSEAAKEAWSDPGAKEKRVSKMYEVWEREEVKAKHSKSLKAAWEKRAGWKHSEDSKKKMSASQKRRFSGIVLRVSTNPLATLFDE